MLELAFTYSEEIPDAHTHQIGEQNLAARRYLKALQLYNRVAFQGQLFRIAAQKFHRPVWLLDLAVIQSSLPIGNARYAGLMEVPIRKIIGSEGRTSDFDCRFHPMNERLRTRWIDVATGRLALASLPAVELIQIGEVFFVRDGHHRISVARAMGAEFIDAEVTVWDSRQIDSSEPVVSAAVLTLRT